MAEQLQAQHNAVKMLANRVRLILEYIRAMERGEVPKSHEVLREAKSLTHRLPVLNSEIFQEEYYTVSRTSAPFICAQSQKIEICFLFFSLSHFIILFFFVIVLLQPQQYNDVLLQTYLGSITKACHDLHQFVSKFNVLLDRHSSGRRMRGLFF